MRCERRRPPRGMNLTMGLRRAPARAERVAGRTGSWIPKPPGRPMAWQVFGEIVRQDAGVDADRGRVGLAAFLPRLNLDSRHGRTLPTDSRPNRSLEPTDRCAADADRGAARTPEDLRYTRRLSMRRRRRLLHAAGRHRLLLVRRASGWRVGQ